MVPPERYAKFVANISIVNALALLLGPIVGGAIASHTNWRWILIIKFEAFHPDTCSLAFLMPVFSIPIAVPALVLSFIFIPKNFPYHGRQNDAPKTRKPWIAKSTLNRIDIPGTILVLFATLALTAAFEEAGKKFPWRSPYVISLLSISGVLWIGVALWERYTTLSNTTREPILPWRFLNREMMGILL